MGLQVQQIMQAWQAGEEVRGLDMYWDMVYGYLARLLDSDAQVRAATHIVRFETMCESPKETLRAVLGHCQLPDGERVVQQRAPGVRYPAYYQHHFSERDLQVIAKHTAGTARLWGY